MFETYCTVLTIFMVMYVLYALISNFFSFITRPNEKKVDIKDLFFRTAVMNTKSLLEKEREFDIIKGKEKDEISSEEMKAILKKKFEHDAIYEAGWTPTGFNRFLDELIYGKKRRK